MFQTLPRASWLRAHWGVLTAAVVGALLAAGAVAALLFAPAQPLSPSAPVSALQLSADGRAFSDTLSENVFQSAQPLVPGDSLQGRFWVRNASEVPAYLRVGLADMSVDDPAYVSALSLQTVVDGQPARTASLAELGRCEQLVPAQAIQPGEIVEVGTSIAFADMTGTGGQAAAADLSFVVSLSDADPAVVSMPLCGSTQPESSPTTDSGSASGDVQGSVVVGGGLVKPNTAQRYEEYAILVLLGAALGGAALRLYAHRRWEREEEEDGHDGRD